MEIHLSLIIASIPYTLERILVTGGLGFIGSHICDYFIANGHDVSIFDNLSSNVLSEEYYESRADVFIGNVSRAPDLEAVFSKRYDLIFHFAANASVPKSIEDEETNFETNVVGTHNIIRMAGNQASSFVLASTSAVYGESGGTVVDEDYIKKPTSPYGLSKLIDEDLCFHYGRIKGINVIAFRFFNVYGPRQKHYVMSDFLEKLTKAKGSKSVSMFGTGNEIRDFINIEDIIKAVTLPLKNEKMWGEAYNVGSGVQTKIRDLLELMLAELGLTYDIAFSGKRRRGDVTAIHAKIDKIASLGFRPSVDLRSGIKKYIESERKNSNNF
jgi:UDP-glucose 4-epimerase